MEENKKSKKIVWIITAIIILILGIVGYIVYDNFLKVDKTIPNYGNNDTTTTTKKVEKDLTLMKFKDNDTSVESIVLDYMESCRNDNNCFEIEDNKNYQEEEINENIKITCNNYDYQTDNEENKFCYSANLKIDNKVNFKYSNDWSVGLSKINILKSNEFYIIQEQSLNYGRGRIVIFDINGNQLKEINNTTTYLTALDNKGNFIETNIAKDEYKIKLINNKLYFAYTDDDYDNFCIESRDNYIYLVYIDLKNNFNKVELQKIHGIASQEC